jgi:nitroimidazol reductase NimA-like FMN-containing flavoprotein (pyridoxamine 5'-phosphate oxidase superfamily)
VSIRLSREEAFETLANSHTGILTSMKADGTPITLPVWFAVLDERIYVGGPEARKRTTRLRRNPRCCFLVESGIYWRELKAVLVTCTAREVTDEGILKRISEIMSAKYDAFRSPRTSMPEETRSVYENPASATFELVPDDRILSFDNSRIKLS